MKSRSLYQLCMILTTGVAVLPLMAQSAYAQGDKVESVVVTGSRVTTAANAPTPLVILPAEQLLATTPSDLPTALNKLPVFASSGGPHRTGSFRSAAGNVLNLRNFGAQRTLVLMDGHRATPTNTDGTIDIDTLPQMLISRVDIVTGGASAVYGSDAVTGVVNFILDKNFVGFKAEANAGISNFGDGASHQVGLAWGTELFGGRGHFETSIRHRYSDSIPLLNRPAWGNATAYVATGAGTRASPYATTINGRLTAFSFGGKIACTGCSVNGQQFVSNGVIGPFDSGTPTRTSNISSGGDGTYVQNQAATSSLRTDNLFARFSYNLSDNVTFYLHGTAGEAKSRSFFNNNYMQTGASPNVFSTTNAFLSPTAQAQLAGAANGRFVMTKYFLTPEYGGIAPGFAAYTNRRYLTFTSGMEGTLLDKYNWDAYFTHGETRLTGSNPYNQSSAKMYAAMDAVRNSAGQVVCQVSTTAFAGLYPNCIPLNAFGPTSMTQNMFDYMTEETRFVQTNTLSNLGGSIAGPLFELPAGPVTGALSGETRWQSLAITPNVTSGFVDCTGLRFCNPDAVGHLNGNVGTLPRVSHNVWEFAGELDIPVLKDVPLAQSLSINMAGRFTNYSGSGDVQTWKIGVDNHVTDDIRFRATASVDIRAPTLFDLYSPQQVTHQGFNDLHTNVSQSMLIVTQGNSNLKPEVARTFTAGVVLTPSWIPRLTVSLDYYRIGLKNAITNLGGNTAGVQQECEASGGTSILCELIERPLPFSNRTPANYPTRVLVQVINSALNKMEGWDFEVNYSFDMADLWEETPGTVNLRLLANDNPYTNLQTFSTARITTSNIPKSRATLFFNYTLGDWAFNIQDRWLSKFVRSTQRDLVFFEEPYGKSLNYVDLSVNKTFNYGDETLDAYVSVQNVLNAAPPVQPSNTTLPGFYPGGQSPASGSRVDGVDNVGRYFTLGIRYRM